ncbi:MAG: rhomboid family intramembrane serine protease [Dehalococcoidia bacterium]
MIPYRDSLRSRSTPYVNYTLIGINIAVFLYELSLSGTSVRIGGVTLSALDRWMYDWGTVGCRVAATCPIVFDRTFGTAPNPWLTLITATFIHAGLLHLVFNMLFLWIFGDNVEDAMGHLAYLFFYLIVGILAGLAQVASDPNSTVPSVGASGAIAGVMAAYLVLYPGATVHVLIPIIIIPWFTSLPAFVLMIVWFAIQVMSGLAEFGARATGGEGGVAWFAHIGGFVAGLVLVWFFRTRRRSHDANRPPDRRDVS